ncbi:hypothetical protein A1A1_18615 [Planococcus antarcticus DSM 14505]|uniref:YolD-like family protein n=1 Tax=Planococcus antarcticus DSM 14505 TaxID=1185653 RepID=A0A1C7DHJ2_9BACL|nr:YolD-like family protein [Planococcus antarcticus]ANU10878.1 hypothetical protein BBH88_11425 [Planococcus antarcticus DSM 14505]EIM04984.1 hypothetical protein A1A1_18615 [Planococcus antarcticus DSM 14505]
MKGNKHLKIQGDVKDRGMIKWQGLMLTEHVELIKTWKEDYNKVAKSYLDEHNMQLIQEEIDLAMKRQCIVYIHTWNNGEITEHHGTISNVDIKTRILYYEDPFKNHRLNLDDVVSITMVN